MKLKDFSLEGHIKRGYGQELLATVTVVTGMLWWRKEKRVRLNKPAYGNYWVFTDTGKFTPDLVIEELEKADSAKKSWEELT